MSEQPDLSIQRPLKIFLAATAIALVLAALFAFRQIFLVAVIGLLGGVLVEPLIRWLQTKCRLPHGVSVALTALVLIAAALGLFWAGYTLIAGQVKRLAEQGPEIQEKLTHQIDSVLAQFSWLGLDKGQINAGAMLGRIGAGVLKALTIGAEGLSYAVVVFMIALFIAANFRGYGRGFLTLFPPRRRDRLAELGGGSVRVVRRWFLGQLVVVTISGVLTAIAMGIIGLDYWLLVAVLTVVLDFVPFFGAVITGTVAVLLTLGSEPEKVTWVLIAYVLIQQIETDVVLPVVMKGRVRLPEAHLLIFLLLMGAAFGVVGIFLAPPVFAVLHHLYRQAYIPWVEQAPARRGRAAAHG